MNLEDVLLRGTRASQPLAANVATGTLYYVINEGVIEQSNGTSWLSYSSVSIAQPPVLFEENYIGSYLVSNLMGGGSNLNLSINGASVATAETQAAGTAYADLATPGPSATVVIQSSGLAIVNIGCFASRTGTGNSAFASPNLSGANTVAPSDDFSGTGPSTVSTGDVNLSTTLIYTGLTPGSTTFKLQYHNDGGATWTFRKRNISVISI